MSIFTSGTCEPLKLSVHAALGSLALLCAGYNAIAWIGRREPHLAANTALYAALVAVEVKKVAHHRAK